MHTFTMEQIEEANEDMGGFCIECGNAQYELEPDARERKCDECGALKVYGAEELVVMGHVTDD